MAFDASKPAGSQKIRLSDEEIRANQAAVEDAFNREHTFPGVMGSTAGQHKIPVVGAHSAGAEGRLEVLNDVLEYYSNGSWRKAGDIPAGTTMLFLQAAAPTGWTQDTSINDKVLRLVDGEGAGEGGDWEITGLTTDDHTLTVDEMPAHTHNIKCSGTVTAGPYPIVGPMHAGNYICDPTGGGAAHDHGAVISDAVWRPAYVDVIACVKD